MLDLAHLTVYAYKERSTNFLQSFNSKCVELSLHADPFLEMLKTNPSEKLPYHNTQHLLDVAYDVNIIGALHGLTATLRRTLFVAGLFHDFNHTGISKPDQQNVNLALEGLTQNTKLIETERLDLDVLQGFVQSTCTDDEPPYSLPAGFLRDADLLSWCYRDSSIQCEALSAEQGVPVTLESSAQFFSTVSFYSTAVQDLFAQKWGI